MHCTSQLLEQVFLRSEKVLHLSMLGLGSHTDVSEGNSNSRKSKGFLST